MSYHSSMLRLTTIDCSSSGRMNETHMRCYRRLPSGSPSRSGTIRLRSSRECGSGWARRWGTRRTRFTGGMLGRGVPQQGSLRETGWVEEATLIL